MAGSLSAREATSLYVELRGRAQGTSTRRLRWQLRRLPQHSDDDRTRVRRRAVTDELALRDHPPAVRAITVAYSGRSQATWGDR